MAREPAPHTGGVTRECTAGQEACGASFVSRSKWDDIRAQNDGWFSSRQKPGVWWCPKHVPDWVPAWRARKAAEKAASDG